MIDKDSKCIYISVQSPMIKHYKPVHERKTKMVPVRMTEEFFKSLQTSSARIGLPISVLLREGAKAYIRQIERKDGPKKGG